MSDDRPGAMPASKFPGHRIPDEPRLIESDDLSSEEIRAAFTPDPDVFTLILEELRKMNAKLDQLNDRAFL